MTFRVQHVCTVHMRRFISSVNCGTERSAAHAWQHYVSYSASGREDVNPHVAAGHLHALILHWAWAGARAKEQYIQHDRTAMTAAVSLSQHVLP